MKIAYLILAHKDPKHLGKLIQKLKTSNSFFFVHIDLKSNIDHFIHLKQDNVFFINERIPIYYDYSLVQATLSLLDNALNNMIFFDYFIRLHGVDYPVQPAFYIEEFFTNNFGKEFIETMPRCSGDKEFPIKRIEKYEIRGNTTIVKRWIFHFFTYLRIKRNRFHEFQNFRLIPYWGSALWALSRDACEYTRYFSEKYPKIINFYKNTHAPEEMIFQTILGNSPYINRITNYLHYVDWSTQLRHPPELTEKHLSIFSDTLAVRDGNREILFANKFSSQNENVVDMLDKIIEGKEAAYRRFNAISTHNKDGS